MKAQQQTPAASLLRGLLGWLPALLRLASLPAGRAPGSVQLRSSTGAGSGCGGCACVLAGRRCSKAALYTDRLRCQATATMAVTPAALTP